MRRSELAFSLVELLVVAALMIVIAVTLYGFGSASFQRRQLLACEKNLQSMFVALNIYATENRETYPVVPSAKISEIPLSLLIPRCTTVTEMFICPGSKSTALPEGQPFQNKRISYAYYMGQVKGVGTNGPLLSDRQVNIAPKRKGEPLFSNDGKPPGNNHHQYGGNVMFLDGSVEDSKPVSRLNLFYPTNRITLLNPKP